MHLSIASPPVLPSPIGSRVGIHDECFETCSGFTRVTAHWIAQPPKATFVTRLRRSRLPSPTARQLPDQSTIFWVEPSSTDTPRLRGALPMPLAPESSTGHGFPDQHFHRERWAGDKLLDGAGRDSADAARLLDSGVDTRVAQILLGHATIGTTAIYAHLTEPTHTSPKAILDKLMTGL